MDLIKLDTSIELEDFDPLNQNAKPIPSLPAVMPMSNAGRMNGFGVVNHMATTTTSAIPGSFNNPLYPYFEPPSMASPTPSQQAHRQNNLPFGDDDTELLRKYGLDQLTLETEGATAINKSTTISGDTTRNWTTFE